MRKPHANRRAPKGKKTLGVRQLRVLEALKSREFRSRYELAKFLAGGNQRVGTNSQFRGVYKALESLVRYELVQLEHGKPCIVSERAALVGTGAYLWTPHKIQSAVKHLSTPVTAPRKNQVSSADPLFLQNIALARHLAHRYSSNDAALFDDLFNEALLGLHKAVQRYRTEGHPAFKAYVRVRIQGAILDGLRTLRPGGRRAPTVSFVAISEETDPEEGTQIADPSTPDMLELLEDQASTASSA